MEITGQFRWKKVKERKDLEATGEIPIIVFDGIKHLYPEMTRLIDKTGEWEPMFEGVEFKYTVVESPSTNQPNYDWAIKVDPSVFDRIQVFKHPVPTFKHSPVQVL